MLLGWLIVHLVSAKRFKCAMHEVYVPSKLCNNHFTIALYHLERIDGTPLPLVLVYHRPLQIVTELGSGHRLTYSGCSWRHVELGESKTS